MFVLTVDQRGSRSSGDLVEGLLAGLADSADSADSADAADRPLATVRPFERTAGDEVQGILDDPATVVALVLDLVREDSWSVGIGVGPVDQPLPPSTRAGSGPAFSLAREAVTRAKSRPTGLAVAGTVPAAAQRAQTALDLVAALAQRRTDRGWEAVDLAAQGLTQVEIAERLDITKQAVSQRLQAADWHLEGPARELATHLLGVADESGAAATVGRS